MIVAFQNCGQQIGMGFDLQNSLNPNDNNDGSDDNQDGDDENEGGSTGDVCDDALYAKFSAGYYQFLKQNCATCHDGTHEAPGFAQKNALRAFDIFRDVGYLSVSNNAVSSNHNPPATGSHHTTAISNLKAEWEVASDLHLECRGETSAVDPVVTDYKSNSAMITNKANSAYWASLMWDLNSNSDMSNSGVLFPLKITIESQVAKVNGVEVGYAMRNPTMSVTSGSDKFRVRGLYFYANDKFFDSATVYRNIDAVICAGTPFNMAPIATGNAQILVISKVALADKFAIHFDSIQKVDASTPCGSASVTTPPEDNTPATVTFTQLVSTDATLGVFKKQCISCHSGASASAGLDLTNYTAAKGKASKIVNRINDSGSPMPPAGLMSSSSRAIIEKWVTIGTPQN